MARLNEDVKRILKDAGIWAFATVDPNGVPNVVPIDFVDILNDGQLMLISVAMKKTLANIEKNNNVAISVWHEHEGYQIKGKATVETSGPNFDAGVTIVKSIKDFLDPTAVVIVDINEIYITTPGPDSGKTL